MSLVWNDTKLPPDTPSSYYYFNPTSTPYIPPDFCISTYSATLKKQYKPDQRVHPVPATFPEEARVTRQFPEDPLLSLSSLSTHPPEFIPTKKTHT